MTSCTDPLCPGFVSRGFGAIFGRGRYGRTYTEPCGTGTIYTATVDMVGIGVLNISANKGIATSDIDMIAIGIMTVAATGNSVTNWHTLRRTRVHRCCRLPITRRPERCKKIPCCERRPCRKK